MGRGVGSRSGVRRVILQKSVSENTLTVHKVNKKNRKKNLSLASIPKTSTFDASRTSEVGLSFGMRYLYLHSQTLFPSA